MPWIGVWCSCDTIVDPGAFWRASMTSITCSRMVSPRVCARARVYARVFSLMYRNQECGVKSSLKTGANPVFMRVPACFDGSKTGGKFFA